MLPLWLDFAFGIKSIVVKRMTNKVDINEYNLLKGYAQDVLDILLTDRSVTKYKNDGSVHHIFWATHDYEYLGEGYTYCDEIMPERITGEHSNVVIPRVMKSKHTQNRRVKKMAEVFTPSWVCNMMVNNIDEKFFGRRDAFNAETGENKRTWESFKGKIEIPEGKTWMEYVKLRWMEITCGEAPFMTSRYDTTTGTSIPLEERIGFLDRKLRLINENTDNRNGWLEAAVTAYQCCTAYEWQGDNLLMARKSLLLTFVDNFEYKFGELPSLDALKEIADIISWNVWQMDGLKGVVPNSCHDVESRNLYGEVETTPCPGCKTNNIHKHNGIPALMKEFKSGNAYPYHLIVKDRK